MLQLSELFTKFDELHLKHGSKNVTAIYGAGQIVNPKICLIFMNPTAKNISSKHEWEGIRAPWIGTKNVWRLLYKLQIFKHEEIIAEILRMKPEEWTPEFAEKLYSELANQSIYITNIAKCTQDDARHVSDSVYKEYFPAMMEELNLVKPRLILAMGNQVNSVLLQKPISVSKYLNEEFEILKNGEVEFKVYPSYYPIGQGTRNIHLATKRINNVLKFTL